jgi:serine/threonine-protein kinase HipA
MVALPVAASARRHILKLQPPEYPYLVENEAFFLDLARRSGVPAAPATVVHDRDGRSGLLVERFDRVSVDGTVRAVAQEDACQVLGRYPADKYNLSTTEVVTALAAATGAPVVAARELLRQFAFAYLTGNGDAHAKNFSVFHPGDEWRVTPAYDTASTYPYNDTTLALQVNGRNDERVGRADFIAVGAVANVRSKAVESMLDDLVARASGWLDELTLLPFDGRTVHKLRRSVEYRLVRLAR